MSCEMVVVLQNARTLEYVRGDGGWTAAVEKAHDFGAVVRALDYALKRGLQDVRPVVRCGDPGLDLRLPAVCGK